MRLFALLLLWPSVALGSLADTVGWTGGCTCVVVHPDGWALTAEHCGHKGEFEVEIAGRTVKAREVYDPPKNKVDEAVLVKLDGGPFLFAAVADNPIAVGDRFFSWGFPAGNRSYISGKVIPAENDGKAVLAADGAAIGGHSGGPLFNSRGQVCGLLSQSDRAKISTWIPLESVREAMRHAQAEPQGNDHVVWVLTSAGCLPCENLKADYRRGQFPGVVMKFVDIRSQFGRDLVERIEQATGNRPRFNPTLWAEGSDQFTTGYTGVGTLRSWLTTILRLPITGWEIVTGDRVGAEPETEVFPREDLAPEADEQLEPIADSGPEPDFAGARLLLFAPRKLSSDTAANALLSLSRAATSQVREATDGKAAAIIVSERQNPEQYAAACGATGVTPGEFAGIVMVPAQSHGLRATIRGKLLSVVRERLPAAVRDAPVGLLTEVGSPKEYAAAVAALAVQSQPATQDPVEGGDPTSDEVPWYQGLIGLVTLFFGGGSKVNDRLKLALEKL